MTWPLVPLADVAEVRGGIQKQPKRVPRGNAFPFMRVANVTAMGLDLRHIHEIELFDGELDRYRLRRGDLLVVEGNGSASQIGRAAVWDGSIQDAVHQNHLIRVRPAPDLDERFLGLYWNSPPVRDALSGAASSTSGLHTLSVAKLKRIMVALPPLAEQERIVDLLEDHLSRLDAANAYLETGVARARVWCAELIDQLVWSPQCPLREVRSLLREPMRNGRSDRAVQSFDDGTRTLTLTAVTKNSFSEENTKLTTTTPDRARGLWLEPGDVFVQRSNTPALVGTSARYGGPPDWAIFPDLLIRLRTDESVMDSRFLAAALRSKQGHAQLRRRAKGAAGSMPKIDQEAVGSALVPLPSQADQRKILTYVDEAEAGLRRLLSELEAAQRRLSALRRSVLAAAFAGRLSDTGGDLSKVEEGLGA